jgi:hypothetical protein
VHSNNPRIEFAPYRALTKVSITQELPPGAQPTAETKDDITQFVTDCLPAIDAALFIENQPATIPRETTPFKDSGRATTLGFLSR